MSVTFIIVDRVLELVELSMTAEAPRAIVVVSVEALVVNLSTSIRTPTPNAVAKGSAMSRVCMC